MVSRLFLWYLLAPCKCLKSDELLRKAVASKKTINEETRLKKEMWFYCSCITQTNTQRQLVTFMPRGAGVVGNPQASAEFVHGAVCPDLLLPSSCWWSSLTPPRSWAHPLCLPFLTPGHSSSPPQSIPTALSLPPNTLPPLPEPWPSLQPRLRSASSDYFRPHSFCHFREACWPSRSSTTHLNTSDFSAVSWVRISSLQWDCKHFQKALSEPQETLIHGLYWNTHVHIHMHIHTHICSHICTQRHNTNTHTQHTHTAVDCLKAYHTFITLEHHFDAVLKTYLKKVWILKKSNMSVKTVLFLTRNSSLTLPILNHHKMIPEWFRP